MKLVLFLGAGFSARFNLPVMSEFLPFAHTSQRLSDEERKLIGSLVVEARQANSFVQSSPVNLEDILTFAMMGDRLELGLPGGAPRGERVRRILQRVYTEIRRTPSFWSDFEDFSKFLNTDLRRREHEITIVTTNYDLMVECALHRMSQRVNPGVAFRQIEDGGQHGKDALHSPNGILVLKLHGSVNWYEPEDDFDGLDVEGRLASARDFSQGWPEQVTLPMAAFVPAEGSARPPLIVPPSFLKPDMTGPLARIWAQAAGALHAARRVVFVGYSFPPSDTEMKYFLARSLVDNPDLESIALIDPNAEAIIARIRNEASGYGTHFRDFLRGEPCRWVETKLDWS